MDLAKIRKKAKKSIEKKVIKENEDKQKDKIESVFSKEEILKTPVEKKQKEKPLKNDEKIEKILKEAIKQASVEIEVPSLAPSPVPLEETSGKKQKEKKFEKLLIFKVGNNRYAIPIGELSQIIEDRSLTIIPFVPSFLKGIFSLRGRIVGVIDVLERMGLRAKEMSLTRKIIVLEKEGDLFGLRVDGIDHVVEVDILSLEPPPEGFDSSLQEYVVGVFHFRNKTIALLNLDSFLNF